MKYETPEIKVIEIDAGDIIQTSGILGGGGENETPFNPALATYNSNLDNNY